MAHLRKAPASVPVWQSLPFEPLLDSDQAASLLRIHPKTLQQLAREGRIHGVRVGRLWRFRTSDLDEWLVRRSAS